jgi:hypothetical protein
MLMCAVLRGDALTVAEMAPVSDVNVLTPDGRSLLYVALDMRRSDIVSHLLISGTTTTTTNGGGKIKISLEDLALCRKIHGGREPVVTDLLNRVKVALKFKKLTRSDGLDLKLEAMGVVAEHLMHLRWQKILTKLEDGLSRDFELLYVRRHS